MTSPHLSWGGLPVCREPPTLYPWGWSTREEDYNLTHIYPGEGLSTSRKAYHPFTHYPWGWSTPREDYNLTDLSPGEELSTSRKAYHRFTHYPGGWSTPREDYNLSRIYPGGLSASREPLTIYHWGWSILKKDYISSQFTPRILAELDLEVFSPVQNIVGCYMLRQFAHLVVSDCH